MSKFIKHLLNKGKKSLRNILKRQSVVWSALIAICSFVIVGFVIAWSNPTVNPPGGNIPAPINVSSTTQTKSGSFGILGTLGVGTTSSAFPLFVVGAMRQVMNTAYDVWIQGGTSTSGGNLRNLAILGVDEDSGDKLYVNYSQEYGSGTILGYPVGIGTTTPGNTLSVAGTFQVTGNANICNLMTYTATSGTTLCPSGFYTWAGMASTTGQILCCKVSNPI